MKLLIMEDDLALASAMRKIFEKRNWDVTVCYLMAQALEEIHSSVDLYLLDVRMPDGTGFEVCEKIRSFSDRPVLFISSDCSESSMLQGYSLQADDYIEKPFKLPVLFAKCQRLMEKEGKSGHLITCNQDHLDVENLKLICKETAISLKQAEAEILKLLFQSGGRLVTRERLCMALQTDSDQVLSVRISELRKKLPEGRKISSVRGGGYRWIS